MKYILLLFFVIFTLTGCNTNETNMKNKLPGEDFICDFVLTGDYYNEDSNVILSGTSINIEIDSNYIIDGLIVNDNYYNNINSQISLLVRTEDFFNLTISNIIIKDIYFNVAYNKTIKVVNPLDLLTATPTLTTDAHSLNIDLNCYKDFQIPIYMSIRNNNDYLFEDNITEYNYNFDEIQTGLVDIYIYADFNYNYLIYTKNLYFHSPINVLSEMELGYNILTFTFNEGVILDSLFMDGKTYEIDSTTLTIEKPVGLTFDFYVTLRYYYNGKLFSETFIINFLETKIPDYEASYQYESLIDSYFISFDKLDVFDGQTYEILIYENEQLVASSDSVIFEFSEYHSNTTYRAVLNLFYFDTVSMTEKTMSKEITFKTRDRYESYIFYNLTLEQNKGIIYFSWVDSSFTISDIKVYYKDNLIYEGTDLVFNTCGEGNYKIEITFNKDEYGKKYQQTRTEYIYASNTKPELIISTSSTDISVSYNIIDESDYSKIVDFKVYLYSLGQLITTSNSFNDTFYNLKPNTAYEVVIKYTYYSYNNINELQDAQLIYTKESLYGR